MVIKFAPLNVPLERRLQTLAAGVSFTITALGGLFGFGSIFLLLLFTNLWPIVLLYLTWIWIFDTEVCERGGRSIKWFRGLVWWKYFKEYFPITLQKTSDFELDPTRNYLFCSFPHGLLATGALSSFGTTAVGYNDLFPKHKPHILTLKQNFKWPFFRDYLLAIGMCAASAKSINWIIGSAGGGNVAILVVGGAAESFYSRPGKYQLVLKNRKGFIKLALRNGSPLVPVFSFGEIDIFDQVSNPEGSFLRYIQEKVKSITGIVPIVPLGRGFLQYSFGIVPRRRPINIVVGTPIDVEKTENPSQEQIDVLHETFIKELTNLFEKHKSEYLENAEETKLVIE